MDRPVTEPVVPGRNAGVLDEPSVAAVEPAAGDARDVRQLEELLNYAAVPSRNTTTWSVKIIQGDRLTPLPYPLEEENP